MCLPTKQTFLKRFELASQPSKTKCLATTLPSAAIWPTTPISRIGLQPGTRKRKSFTAKPLPAPDFKLRSGFMRRISRRPFLQTASASAIGAALWGNLPRLMANPLGLPLGLQLYSVRDLLPKDYEGTLRQLGELGYREVEAAGFFNHTPADVKQAMDHAGLR